MQSALPQPIEENPSMKYPLPTIEIKHRASYCEWMTLAGFHFCFFQKRTKDA